LGADRSRTIIKENEKLTCILVGGGETAAAGAEGISFPLDREEAVES
jgi:hypothetical protein